MHINVVFFRKYRLIMIKMYKNLNRITYKITTLIKRNYGLEQVASSQRAAMNERCILVDKLDRPVGEATKLTCHKIDKEGCLPLHRAFSVFLFNSKGELLLQKRSKTKVRVSFHVIFKDLEYFTVTEVKIE